MHKLIIEDDEGKTTVVPVSRGEISIGRMEGNTIRLMERNVSRKHARLLRENGAVFIEDLNSFNGVKINGERIDKRLEVKEGDLVEIGDYHLALQAVEVEDEPQNRAETVVQPPRLPDPVVPAAAQGAHANGKNEAWRNMATLPDFSVGEDVMREARAGMESREADTANMRPTSLGPPDPVVAPPPPKTSGLPPFPASQGLSSPGALAASTLADLPFSSANAGVAALRARDDAALRTEQIQVGPARVSDVPRLVCVSTEYAGKEFPINRPEVVIGRVEDNDIVIEHRSVSRNHAKVMYDGRVHKIIDLQSANGILVNNEEYAITDLRKGDLIELGHVKFRFIPAGEAFAPTEEEAKAMLEAGVTPPPSAPAPVLAPAARPLEPPTIPHKTQMDLRGVPGRDLTTQRTEELAPSDTVEMPVHVDPSTAATITDTPIDVLSGSFQPKISAETPAEPVTQRPLVEPRAARAHEPDARPMRRNDTLPEPTAPAAPALRVGGTAAASRRPPMDDDSDVRSQGKSNRIVVAVGVVALLLAGLVVAILKLSGGGQESNVHDQRVTQLLGQGRIDEADTYIREHFKEASNGPALMDAIHEARRRANAASAASAVPTVAPETPAPTAAPQSAAPDPSEPPEGDAPPEPEPTPAVTAAPRTAAPSPVPAVDRGLARRQAAAKEALKTAASLMAFKPSATGEIEAALKECVKLDDTLADCHYRLGVLYAGDARNDLAYKHYRRFVELAPDHQKAASVRAILQGQQGRKAP